MITIELLSPQKKHLVKTLVQEVLGEQGILSEFYWPPDMLGPELLITEALGAFLGEDLIGVVLYRDNGQAWEISLVASHPDHRRRGFTKALLKHLIGAKGHERELWLEVHEKNIKAQNLYEKLGFRRTGQRPRYYQDGARAYLYACP